MNDSVFTPAFLVFSVLLGAGLAALELLWLRGSGPLPWSWLAAIALLNLAFFLLLVAVRNTYFFLFVFPIPLLPALYVFGKIVLYYLLSRSVGPVRHPWGLALTSLLFHPLVCGLAYTAFDRVNPSLSNLTAAVRDKSQGRLQVMLLLAYTREPGISILLNEALSADNRDALRRLTRYADPRREYWMREGSAEGQWLLARWMLDRGLKPEEINATQAPSFAAVALGQGADELRYAIAKGFDPARHRDVICTAIDEQPLVDGVAGRMKEKIGILLSHGADVNGEGPMRFGPLFTLIPSRLDLAPVLTFLLEKGADVNARSVNPMYPDGKPVIPPGITPLMLAAHDGRLEYVRILLAHGADPSLKDSTGRTARDYAELEEIRKLL